MFEKTPNIYTLENLLHDRHSNSACINGKWVPARPIGFWSWSYRIKAAWLVFTGRADAVTWPGGQ
ncbi:MAG: hypothetical protein JWP44_5006 [Mucilaginibacter sp.]|nr:hypothetical protein [Mucilaginibacter sp.]